LVGTARPEAVALGAVYSGGRGSMVRDVPVRPFCLFPDAAFVRP